MPAHSYIRSSTNKPLMEASLHPPLLSIPMEYDPSYGQCSLQANEDIIFPSIMHDIFPDNGQMDATVYVNRENFNTGFPGMSCGLEKSLPSGHDGVCHECSSQQEILEAIQGELMEENSLTDLLLAGAEAVETENWHLASIALARLDHLLLSQEMDSNPLSQLACYFAQGLRPRTSDLGANVLPVRSMVSDGMSAYQMLQELSPYVKFGHFTANQAILEAAKGDRVVHILDLDVMEGIQWPPLMVDLASRTGTSLWITALVGAGNVEVVHRTGRRLVEFADSIGLPLRFDWLYVDKEGDCLERVEAGEGSLIINCMVNQLQRPSRSFQSLNALLGGVRKLRPKLVVLVEEELFRFGKSPFKSFVEFFCEALHHFSAIFDSLKSSFVGGYRMGLRLVEREMLGPRIMDSVGYFLRVMNGWGGGFRGLEGFKAIPLSSCNVSQAKFLVGLFSTGYGVQHEKGGLSLCWKSRPLTTVSIWVPA